MKDKMQHSMHILSYFLWQYTGHDNALELWNCAKDVVWHMERCNIHSLADITRIRNKSRNDYMYLKFVRSIAYRIYIFTDNDDHLQNWNAAEKLLYNEEWVRELINLVNMHRALELDKKNQT